MREYGFSSTGILLYIDKIVDFVLVQENAGQWKHVFSHILCSAFLILKKNFFWKVFLKNWIIKLYFHLPSKFVFMNSKRNSGVTAFFSQKFIVPWNKKWKSIKDNCFLKMFRSFTFEGSFTVTHRSYDSDLNNGGFCFIIYQLWHERRWHVQNFVRKTVLLWTISCGFNIHRALIWCGSELALRNLSALNKIGK